MVSDFGDSRYCNKCGGEIVGEGDIITMYAGKNICSRTKEKPYCSKKDASLEKGGKNGK